MKHYGVIFFDADDTLLDYAKSEQIALKQVFSQYHLLHKLSRCEKRYHEISNELWRDLENGEMELVDLSSERFRRLFLEHGIEMDPVVFSQDYLKILSEQSHLVQGAEKVIRNFSYKRLAIITNGYNDVQTSRINKSPLKDAFEQIIISEATGFQKPQTGIFDYAFKRLKITDKSNVLIVGDSLTSDIRGGMNYGIDTCWFNPEKRKNHTSIKPTYEISKLESLFEVIK